METPQSTIEAPQEKENKRSPWWLIVILVLLILMMGCCCIGAILCRSSARLPDFLSEFLPEDFEDIIRDMPNLESQEDIQDLVKELINNQEEDFIENDEEEFVEDQEDDLKFLSLYPSSWRCL